MRVNFSKIIGYALLSLPFMIGGGCDDGRIYDEGVTIGSASGTTVNLSCNIEGSDDYAVDRRYSVAIAAFKEGDNFAVISKALSEGDNETSLSGIPDEASVVEVCLINRLRERVFTFASAPLTGVDEIEFTPGKLSTGMFKAIENGIFATTCAQCHGATGHSAASLNLTAGNAYDMLVETPSTVVEGAKRVEPGNASASTLWEAVATDVSDSWAFAHRNLLVDNYIDFIEYWINSGAK